MAIKNKEEAIKIINQSAVLYGKNLSGKNALFVTVKNGKSACFETLFMPNNFLHLTGVKTNLSGELFYKAALNQRLSTKYFSFDDNGMTELKLGILPQLMTIHVMARMIGDYDNSKPLLITDKLAGIITMAMGFINIGGIYLPNTALKKDLRDITSKASCQRIAASFIKRHGDQKYCELSYIAKGLTIDDSIFKSPLLERVDLRR